MGRSAPASLNTWSDSRRISWIPSAPDWAAVLYLVRFNWLNSRLDWRLGQERGEGCWASWSDRLLVAGPDIPSYGSSLESSGSVYMAGLQLLAIALFLAIALAFTLALDIALALALALALVLTVVIVKVWGCRGCGRVCVTVVHAVLVC